MFRGSSARSSAQTPAQATRLVALSTLLALAACATPLSWQHIAPGAPLWSVLPASVSDPALRTWFVHGGYARDTGLCLTELWALDATTSEWQLLAEHGGPTSSVGTAAGQNWPCNKVPHEHVRQHDAIRCTEKVHSSRRLS